MKNFLLHSTWITMTAVVIVGQTGCAAVPAPPAAVPPAAGAGSATGGPPTLWNFLGIPTGWTHKLKANLINRHGHFPHLEPKPPLTALADPANLKSDVPAIKAAAEIKQAEDQAAQKIKAIKYLATIGCTCHDEDGKISGALLAALDECTEAIRVAAAEAIAETSKCETCKACKNSNCCTKEMREKLDKLANGQDDSGCFEEPSARVRRAARIALAVCGAEVEPIEEVPTEELPAPERPEEDKEVPVNDEADVESADPDTERPLDGDADRPATLEPTPDVRAEDDSARLEAAIAVLTDESAVPPSEETHTGPQVDSSRAQQDQLSEPADAWTPGPNRTRSVLVREPTVAATSHHSVGHVHPTPTLQNDGLEQWPTVEPVPTEDQRPQWSPARPPRRSDQDIGSRILPMRKIIRVPWSP